VCIEFVFIAEWDDLVVFDALPRQGCLTPVTFIIPSRSILSPDGDAAVVGGNVLTSQRLCDVVLQAFEACACSQGCMNNFLFGDATFGYYETIAGGSGAGPSYDGTSGVCALHPFHPISSLCIFCLCACAAELTF
jgi:5-oxoprolinase (ATP-hydrolysing)